MTVSTAADKLQQEIDALIAQRAEGMLALDEYIGCKFSDKRILAEDLIDVDEVEELKEDRLQLLKTLLNVQVIGDRMLLNTIKAYDAADHGTLDVIDLDTYHQNVRLQQALRLRRRSHLRLITS